MFNIDPFYHHYPPQNVLYTHENIDTDERYVLCFQLWQTVLTQLE